MSVTTGGLSSRGGGDPIVRAIAMAEAIASEPTMATLMSSGAAWQAIVADKALFQMIVASPTAWSAVMTDSDAYAQVVASSVAMEAVAASSVAMEAVAASSVAMSAIISDANAAKIVESALQPYRSILEDTLTDGSRFSLSTVSIGRGSGTWTVGLSSPTVYLPIIRHDNVASTNTSIKSVLDTNFEVIYAAAKGGYTTFSSGLTLRGTRVSGSGGNYAYVRFNVYTAR